jgi:tripartite-type tricarboxylate transporter receptor subunit TctC
MVNGLAFTGLACGLTPRAFAQQSFPNQTVKIVVPAAAGSTADALSRVVADQLARKWQTSVVIENIAGAAMNIGARVVARAPADGHTLMIAPPQPLSYAHLLYKNLGYEPMKFAPVTVLAKIPNVLVARKDFPATDLKSFIAYAKANPGKINYGSGGLGTTAHLSAAQLEALAGIKMNHVPYRSSQPAMTDLLSGAIDIFFETLATSGPLYRDKNIKAFGIADSKRSDAIPDVPTIIDAGLPCFKSITWFGLVAPPDTPKPIMDRLNGDVLSIMKSPEMVKFLNGSQLTPVASSPADTTAFFKNEAALWERVIREAQIEPQQ